MPKNLNYPWQGYKTENFIYWDNSYIYPTNYCMRKSASIILLHILLFNMIGYRAWFYYAEKKADAAMEARIDKDQYDENDLVTLQIPLYSPYQLEQKTFERTNGEVNINGKTFKYVKRKVSDGNLILLCLADNHKTVLKNAKSEFGNGVNDLAGGGKGSNRIQKSFSGNDYINQCGSVVVCECGSVNLKFPSFNTINLTDPHIAFPGKPPKYIA
jgi:hypothetical protein